MKSPRKLAQELAEEPFTEVMSVEEVAHLAIVRYIAQIDTEELEDAFDKWVQSYRLAGPLEVNLAWSIINIVDEIDTGKEVL